MLNMCNKIDIVEKFMNLLISATQVAPGKIVLRCKYMKKHPKY